ncbi:hypothetical protein EZV73_04190 [Acidaminobacter sp. JC074]|uniref:hypothetical protein n=1 Tax=Acidaminobacter sp. JC074 TaxID=2530199 RepID=UPI001F0F2C38|nr:hypothetical protein [Acidaminobacter sp. JC074]MCH4886752.1 hypothetical protein [Acidaminobacter sp. JC074]
MKKFIYTLIWLVTAFCLIISCTSNKESKLLSQSVISHVKENLEMKTIKDLSQQFTSDDNWFEVGGHMEQVESIGYMKSDSEEIAEAWYKYNQTLSSSKDFIISAEVKVPKHWDKSGKADGQVGIGLFVGKRGDEGQLVFECDLCVINEGMRFVQGQMIKNRKGGEPVAVEMKEVNDESGVIEILYKADDNSLTLIFNDQVISTQKIDGNGPVNLEVAEGDEFVVGFMGFSEWIKIESDSPSLQSVTISN